MVEQQPDIQDLLPTTKWENGVLLVVVIQALQAHSPVLLYYHEHLQAFMVSTAYIDLERTNCTIILCLALQLTLLYFNIDSIAHTVKSWEQQNGWPNATSSLMEVQHRKLCTTARPHYDFWIPLYFIRNEIHILLCTHITNCMLCVSTRMHQTTTLVWVQGMQLHFGGSMHP